MNYISSHWNIHVLCCICEGGNAWNFEDHESSSAWMLMFLSLYLYAWMVKCPLPIYWISSSEFQDLAHSKYNQVLLLYLQLSLLVPFILIIHICLHFAFEVHDYIKWEFVFHMLDGFAVGENRGIMICFIIFSLCFALRLCLV